MSSPELPNLDAPANNGTTENPRQPLIYAVDGAALLTYPEAAKPQSATIHLVDDQFHHLKSGWLGSASLNQTAAQESPKEVVDGYVVGGAMLEAGLATVGVSTMIARGIRTGDNGRNWIFPNRYGIGDHGRDILHRYGNLGAIETNEPDANGRLIPVTRVIRVESLIGHSDPVTGKKITQIDLANRSLSLDAMHQAPYVNVPGRTSFYETFNQPLSTTNYNSTPEYVHHAGDVPAERGILDHLDIVATELRAHQHITEQSRPRGQDVADLVTKRRAFSEELKHVGDELRRRVAKSLEYKNYRRLRTNEDLFERTTPFSGIGDDATFQKHLLFRRFLAGSTVMGAGALLYDAKNTGLGVHSLPGIALESFSAGAWGMAQSAANNDKAWKVTLRGAGWGVGTGLALSALGLMEGASTSSDTQLGGLLHIIPKPTETEALFVGAGMAIPTKNVISKFGVIGGAALLGWGTSQFMPHPIESLFSKW